MSVCLNLPIFSLIHSITVLVHLDMPFLPLGRAPPNGVPDADRFETFPIELALMRTITKGATRFLGRRARPVGLTVVEIEYRQERSWGREAS